MFEGIQLLLFYLRGRGISGKYEGMRTGARREVMSMKKIHVIFLTIKYLVYKQLALITRFAVGFFNISS